MDRHANWTCYEYNGPHLVSDFPVRKEKNLATNTSGYQTWPRVLRYCGGCGNDHLAKYCPNKRVETKMSFGYVGVVPSPSTFETESDNVLLRMISQVPAHVDQLQPVLTPIEETSSQHGNPQEQIKQKRQKHQRNKGKNTKENKKQETSNRSESSDSGSWESIILETSDGARRLYVLQTTADAKKIPPKNRLKLSQKTTN